ncbi:hypothetical protein M446_1067 [Methylobacterium sp. 4-46]|uniref:hypothetical protein n=1 Tax=unclassified Methylobacterium TaxID=2615210 RepID=UPI000152E037|nr:MULTISPECIES: hypothetical protein [Methylobacterium]ACA15597.1 hypothetical protein M446_1067 [Methylobacterium sp. 4-46]WFT81309.1 hypothetical protein QA634_05290 [Methylobacterium nodulans]
MPVSLPQHFWQAVRPGLSPLGLARLLAASWRLRRLAGAIGRAREAGDGAALAALTARWVALHEEAARRFGIPVPAEVYAAEAALRTFAVRDLPRLDREMRRLAWAEARAARARAAGDERAAAAAHRLGQAACDRISALSREIDGR